MHIKKITYASIGILFLLVPGVSMAQLRASLGLPFPSPSISMTSITQPPIQRIAGRMINSLIRGQIAAIIGNTISVLPALKKKVDSALGLSAVMSIDVTNAQIIKNGKKNLDPSMLAVGDSVAIKVQIFPDKQYIAQRVTVAGVSHKSTKAKATTVAIKQKKTGQKSHAPVTPRKRQNPSVIPAKKL